MATLTEIQNAAFALDAEVWRAQSIGTIAPTHDEIRDFCAEVMDADNDACEQCSDVDHAAVTFGRMVDQGDFEGARVRLAELLEATKCFSRRESKAQVDEFLAGIFQAKLDEQKGAA